jgi:hypothetical protein
LSLEGLESLRNPDSSFKFLNLEISLQEEPKDEPEFRRRNFDRNAEITYRLKEYPVKCEAFPKYAP